LQDTEEPASTAHVAGIAVGLQYSYVIGLAAALAGNPSVEVEAETVPVRVIVLMPILEWVNGVLGAKPDSMMTIS
jgi:hypothetical protein